MKFLKKTKPTAAQIESGEGTLSSLRILINVLYALLIFQVFLILPRPGDPELEYLSLLQIFQEHIMQLVVIVVGFILILMYWIQFNRQLGNLKRSSPLHATLAMVQMVCLMLYLYFVRFDMEYDGMTLALQMESIFLALAGFIAAINWRYANKNNLTSDKITRAEEMNIFYSLLPEPLASLFTLPFAAYGANVWTLAFLSIIPIGFLLKLVRKKYEPKISEENNN
jgi:uncharacterized membrane protein